MHGKFQPANCDMIHNTHTHVSLCARLDATNERDVRSPLLLCCVFAESEIRDCGTIT